MSPIIYIEAICDGCSDEFHNGLLDIEFSIMRNGKLLCQTCRDQRPEHEVLKNFSLQKTYDPTEEELEKDKETLEETP